MANFHARSFHFAQMWRVVSSVSVRFARTLGKKGNSLPSEGKPGEALEHERLAGDRQGFIIHGQEIFSPVS